MKMPLNLSNLDVTNTPMYLLLYGSMGVGKTTIASSVLDDTHTFGYPLFLSFDEGMSSVAHRSGIRAAYPKTLQDVLQVRDLLLTPDGRRPIRDGVDLNGVRTVILDNISIWRMHILMKLALDGMAQNRRSEPVLQIQDYGVATNTIAHAVSELKKVPGLHVIVTAGDDNVMSSLGTVVGVKPFMNDALMQYVGFLMSYIWYAAKQEDKYAVLTLWRQGYTIKTRNPNFAKRLEEVTVQQGGVDRKGWFVIPDANYPTLPFLYNLYLEANGE